MRVKLVRKFASRIDGVDLTKISVGDVIDLMPHQAALLIAEGWAEEVPRTPGKVLDMQSSKKKKVAGNE